MGTKRFIVVCSMERSVVEHILSVSIPKLEGCISELGDPLCFVERTFGNMSQGERGAYLSESYSCEKVDLVEGVCTPFNIVAVHLCSVMVSLGVRFNLSDDSGAPHPESQESKVKCAVEEFCKCVTDECEALTAELLREEVHGGLCIIYYRYLKATVAAIRNVSTCLLKFTKLEVEVSLSDRLSREVNSLIGEVGVISSRLGNFVESTPGEKLSGLSPHNNGAALENPYAQSPDDDMEVG